MEMSRKRKRAALLAVVTAGILILVLRWPTQSGSPTSSTGFATPADCLETYRDAAEKGDAAEYLRCLGEPLRSQTRQQYADDRELGEAVRRPMKDLTGWVVSGPEEQGDRATATVHEVRRSGVRDLRVRLLRSGDRWLIVDIEQGSERPPDMPHGTRVGSEPGGKP